MEPSSESLKKPHIAQVAVALAQRIIGDEIPVESERRRIERAALIIGIKSRLTAGVPFPSKTAVGPLKGLKAVYTKIAGLSQNRDIP